MNPITPKAIASAFRETLRGEHPGSLDSERGVVLLSVELAAEIADALDPPDSPPRAPRVAVHTRPLAREETR